MIFKTRYIFHLITGLLAIGLAACNQREPGSSRDADPDRIYLDYHFTAYEEGGDIALKMQFRFGGRTGPALKLEPPGGVMVDGQAVTADSSGIDGAFYELVRPFGEFTGPHRVEYTGHDGKKYEETIGFPAFALEGLLPDTISREGLSLGLAGLATGDVIQVMLTDTAAFSKGIERIDSLKEPVIRFSPEELQVLRSGPVNFQLIRHRSAPLKNATPAGGVLTTTYSLSREVFLR